MISPGQKLDLGLKLTAVRADGVETVTLKDLLKRRTLISVYMKNNTSSCDKQNDSLAAQTAALAKRGVDIIAVSRDTPASHSKYAAKKKISYTLISDPEDSLAKAADAIVEKSMYGKKYFGPARAAFIVEKDGKVSAVIEKVDTKDHAAQVVTVLDTLS